MNKEVIDYILKSREAGQGDAQIKENLLRAGWINENIDKGFNSYLIQNFILKSKGEGLKDKQIIENLINSKYDKNDIFDAYDYLVKKLGRKIMSRYYILWMPFFHRLRYRADIHSYIFKRWGFLNPISGKLISTKTLTGKLMVGIFLIPIVWIVYRSLSIPSTVSSIKTELSRMSGSNIPSQSAQTAITSPISITESTTKSGWKVYTNSDYKFSFQYPCSSQTGTCLGGGSYGSNYETDMILLSTKIGSPGIRITIFSDEDIKKYNNKLVKLGYQSTASSFYYSLPKMYEALNLSPGQPCQIFDENNRYYSRISDQCLVTTINSQKSLQLFPVSRGSHEGNITYLIPRGGTLWLEIIGLDNSYMKELLSNLSFTPGQPSAAQVESQSKEVAIISPILLKDLDAEALKSSGWSWYGSFPSKSVILDWADRDTFVIYLGTPYFKDKNRVYYDLTTMLEGADSDTFVVYDYSFAKDKNRIYLSGIVDYPQSLDVNTLERVDTNFFKDKNNVYFSSIISDKKFDQSSYYHLEPMRGLDADSFETSGGGVYGGRYYVDKNGVYFANYGVSLVGNDTMSLDKISGADNATFQVMGLCGFKGAAVYAKDKNNVYEGRGILGGVDVKTFEFIANFDDGDGGHSIFSCITKDKKCIYKNDQKILDANGSCISPVNCNKDNLDIGCGLK